MEFKGKFLGADVYSDYGHHPTEIRCTLEGCRDLGYKRIFCVYQPHTYTRTAALFPEFGIKKLSDLKNEEQLAAFAVRLKTLEE